MNKTTLYIHSGKHGGIFDPNSKLPYPVLLDSDHPL